ncbi:LuxR C-terminal-related transcriptional regulator [Peribacillus frigoritolerans]|uniref:LuxR C-terminal-related transcriptional regulator n=1 Tax=Peribacillus frigoritolerans TaxID=450367 RepID=UPI002B24781C|nr:LuxR C-terminal-related transcriptional regulator [Peribacillus frigoritolerans]MEB2490078.1 LuxR C-terminal-related transcriptional regulator [Peribacillus frigoritolerans]
MKSIKLMIYGGQGGIEGIIEQEGDIKVMGMTGNEMDFLDSDHTSVIPDVTLEKAIGKLGAFSKREHELLILLTQGETNQQISKKLFLSIGTVKNYISRIYRKLNVNNRPELMALLYGLQNSGMKG